MGFINDPIADLLTRIRNACNARLLFLDVSHNGMKEAIVKVLKENGFIAQYLIKEEKRKKTIRIFLKYEGRDPVIQGLERISKPSRREYVSYRDIPKVLGGMGLSIVSTSKGVLEGEKARAAKMGGELICIAW